MTARSTDPKPARRSDGHAAQGEPLKPQSAREVFGRFVRTLEQLDAARAGSTRGAREQKADTQPTWEVPG